MFKNIKKYNLQITEELEDKIRIACAMSPDKEWSGVLFYELNSDKLDENFTVICKDMLVLDVGTATFTEWSEGPEIINYAAMNDLLDCQTGIIHSHNKMKTFFSSTDLKTLDAEGSVRQNLVSLIVNNAGEYTAAITFKSKIKKHILIESENSFFDKDNQIETSEGIEEFEELTYSELNIIKPESKYNEYIDEFLKLMVLKKSVVKAVNGFKGFPAVNTSVKNTEEKPTVSLEKPEEDLFEENLAEFDDFLYPEVFINTVQDAYALITGDIFIEDVVFEDLVSYVKEDMVDLYSTRFKKDLSNNSVLQFWIEGQLETILSFYDLKPSDFMGRIQIIQDIINVLKETGQTNEYLKAIIKILENQLD